MMEGKENVYGETDREGGKSLREAALRLIFRGKEEIKVPMSKNEYFNIGDSSFSTEVEKEDGDAYYFLVLTREDGEKAEWRIDKEKLCLIGELGNIPLAEEDAEILMHSAVSAGGNADEE